MTDDFEDNLAWLAQGYTVELSRTAARDQWNLTLYGPGECQEMGGTSFNGRPGGNLAALAVSARAWAEEPLAAEIGPRDWLRLCEAAARAGKRPGDLIRQGVHELADRLAAEG